MNRKKLTIELWLTVILFVITICLTTLFYDELLSSLKIGNISQIVYLIIASFILYGNLIFHLTRIGLFKRLIKHKEITDSELDQTFSNPNLPTVTFLIPSYKEEVKVIEQTLWSAALQYYPNKRIVLLIDNSPDPESDKDKKLLTDTRDLITDVNSKFSHMRNIVETKHIIFIKNLNVDNFVFENEIERLKSTYELLIDWFSSHIINYEIENHVDDFYVKNIYKKWLKTLMMQKDKLDKGLIGGDGEVDFIKSYYLKAFSMVGATIESFERKKYVNLSHEPNKAMNINSYLNLIGKNIREFEIDNKHYLEETLDPSVTTKIPDSKYVITLDADSLLTSNYTIKLVMQMEKPHNKKVAVIQTPYSSYPNAKRPVEIIAGATTDIQYNIHQGFTYYNSTYWVGANAMIRKEALDDIKMYELQGEKMTVKYIQDRTVIEDTESSIDLLQKGWKLYNYPERLAYSSTPHDFGSLIIQRARWANGGLIIFPKLVKYILKKPFDLKRWAEFIVRSNYLVSIAGVNIGTLLLLIYPFGDSVFTKWLPLASIPYYFLYIRDLKITGYKVGDIIKVYGLNLILIPINVAGVVKSIEQGITGKKIAFKRTPKVGNHTVSETKFIISIYLLLIYTGCAVFFDALKGSVTHMMFSFANGAILLYSISVFIGFKQSVSDLKSQLFSVRK